MQAGLRAELLNTQLSGKVLLACSQPCLLVGLLCLQVPLLLLVELLLRVLERGLTSSSLDVAQLGSQIALTLCLKQTCTRATKRALFNRLPSFLCTSNV